MKKSSDDLIQELLKGENPNFASSQSPESIAEYIENNYDITEEQFRQALKDNRGRLEEMIGVPITDEQLEQLAGGKSTAAKVGIGAGAAAGAGAIGVAAGSAALIAAYVAIVAAK